MKPPSRMYRRFLIAAHIALPAMVSVAAPRVLAAKTLFTKPASPEATSYLQSDRQAKAAARALIVKKAGRDPDLRDALLRVNDNEGHGFTLAQGSKHTRTDDGITWGLLGFTSFNGELYRVLAQGFAGMSAAERRAFDHQADRILQTRLDDKCKPTSVASFWQAFESGRKLTQNSGAVRPNPDDALATWALYVTPTGKTLYSNVQAFFGWLGTQPSMVGAQWARALEGYRSNVERCRTALNGREPSSIAKELFMDIYTFSNGLTPSQWRELGQMDWNTEKERMNQVVVLVLNRLRANKSKHYESCRERWTTIQKKYPGRVYP